MSLPTSTIGFPRIGPKREVKVALESYWSKKSTAEQLLETTHRVEAQAWAHQAQAGVGLVGVDGTLYDQVLDHILWLGLTPERFQVRSPRPLRLDREPWP
jgi:5-methyltetrahydropteroyltriglutamate--homocysteine methyltransferase